MKKVWLVLVLACLAVSGCSNVQKFMVLRFSKGKGVKPERKINVPFEYASGHTMMVHPVLDGHPCSFYFDTGGITMMDSTLADSLGFKDIHVFMKRLKTAKIKEIDMNGLIVKDMNVGLINFAGTYKASQNPVYGMIGSNFIRFFNTTINYEDQLLEFDRVQKLKKTSPNDHLMKMSIVPPYFPGAPVIFEGKEFDGIIDTGLPYSFVFPVQAMNILTPEQKKTLIKSEGFFGRWPNTKDYTNYLYCPDEIRIGDIRIEKPEIIFCELPGMIDEHSLLIGKYFLEQYKTTLSFKKRQILLSPVKERQNSVAYTVGLSLAIKNYETFKINGIWEKGPAKEAGFTLDTKIISINGLEASQTDLATINNLISNIHVKEITFVILKDNQKETIVLKKRMIL